MTTNWNKRFLDLAVHIGSWSKDPGAKVGAVIVDTDKRIVSVGFNGFPSGVNDSEHILANRELKLMRTIHAEENAILFARRDLKGCSIYVNYPPCTRCAAKIIQTGITNVFTQTPDSEFLKKWESEITHARQLFFESMVSTFMLSGDQP